MPQLPLPGSFKNRPHGVVRFKHFQAWNRLSHLQISVLARLWQLGSPLIQWRKVCTRPGKRSASWVVLEPEPGLGPGTTTKDHRDLSPGSSSGCGESSPGEWEGPEHSKRKKLYLVHLALGISPRLHYQPHPGILDNFEEDRKTFQ